MKILKFINNFHAFIRLLMSFYKCLTRCIHRSCIFPTRLLYLFGYYVDDRPADAILKIKNFTRSYSNLYKMEKKNRKLFSKSEIYKNNQNICNVKFKEKDIMKIANFSSRVFSHGRIRNTAHLQATYGINIDNNNNNVISSNNEIKFSSMQEVEQDCATNANFLQSERDLIKIMKTRFLKTNQYYDAVFVLGAMGSGKTKVIDNEFRQNKVFGQYAYVDTDEIMSQLDGFHENAVNKYYPVARRIAIYLTDWLLGQRLSFVAEGTCVKHLELEDYMIRLKDKGYSVKIYKVPIVPLDLILRRARSRKRRCVPDDVVESIFYDSHFGLTSLVERNKITHLFKELN